MPIATLPKEFADRLTKAVLDEVKRLHQVTLSPISPLDDQTSNPDAPESTVAHQYLPVRKTAAPLLVLLLIAFQLLPLLQGCALLQSPTPALNTQAVSRLWPTQTIQSIDLTRIAHVAQLPPLAQVRPALPVAAFMATINSVTMKAPTTIPQEGIDPPIDRLTGLRELEPQQAENVVTAIVTITVPHAQTARQAVAEESEPAPTPTPLVFDPIPLEKPTTIHPPDPVSTSTPTPLNTQTPVYHVFEPTMTPSDLLEAPTATATENPTATPTIFLRPWDPAEPTSEVTPTANLIPVDTPTA